MMHVSGLKKIYRDGDLQYKYQAKRWDDILVEAVFARQRFVEVRVPNTIDWMLSIYCKDRGVRCRESQGGVRELGYTRIEFYGWADD